MPSVDVLNRGQFTLKLWPFVAWLTVWPRRPMAIFLSSRSIWRWTPKYGIQRGRYEWHIDEGYFLVRYGK